MKNSELLDKIYSRLGMSPFMDLVPISRIEQAINEDKKFKNWADRTGVI